MKITPEAEIEYIIQRLDDMEETLDIILVALDRMVEPRCEDYVWRLRQLADGAYWRLERRDQEDTQREAAR